MKLASLSSTLSSQHAAMPFSLVLPSRRRLAAWLFVSGLCALGAQRLRRENWFAPGGVTGDARPLPEFRPGRERWVGGEPVTTADMHGRVWVLVVWTFGCINCVRSIPYANELTQRFEGEVGVLGIHSPEFDWERDLAALQAALQEHDTRFPSYIDESSGYFHGLAAEGWPLFVVVARQARIRGRWTGEVHAGTERAEAVEELLRQLIAEVVDSDRPANSAPRAAGG